jgi:methyl-accepting chemotaxis protein
MINAIQASTDETVESLDRMNERITAGINQIETAATNLSDIRGSIEDVSASLVQVSDATEDQAHSTQEVASLVDDAVDGMSDVVNAVENTEQTAHTHQQEITEVRQFLDEQFQN